MAETDTRQETPKALSLIIPLYNEADSIVETLNQAQDALQSTDWVWEILVVDDGSTDGSAEKVEAFERPHRLLRHGNNRGYGAALKTGFAAARYEWIAFVDADGSYPLEGLPKLLEATEEADMVVAERSHYKHYSSHLRRLGKAILLPLAQYLTQKKIPDLNSGMRVVRKEIIRKYRPLFPDGFSLTSTLTLAALSAGCAVRWVPTPFHKRSGTSKIRPVRDMRNFVILILRTITYFHPLKVYGPASAAFIALSVAVVIVSEWWTGEVMDVTSLFLFIAGLQFLLIGVLADLVLKILGTRE